MLKSIVFLQEKENPVLKDNDFVKDGCKMYLGSDAKEKILDTLNADVMVIFLFFHSFSKFLLSFL